MGTLIQMRKLSSESIAIKKTSLPISDTPKQQSIV
jgi:hypothetical protein